MSKPRSLLSMDPSARLEQVMDLYAPVGDDGERHPEHGVITKEQAVRLLDMPVTAAEADADQAVDEYLTRCER